MISSILKGRLGNQMFQIATAYTIARKHNNSCAFDLHKTQLGNFAIEPILEYQNTIYSKILTTDLKYGDFTLFVEKDHFKLGTPFTYEKIPYLSNNMLLSGYFQSEKYFKEIGDEVKHLFSNSLIINKLKEKYKDKLKNSLSIHIRMGDYVTLKMLLPQKYYEDSINYIKEKYKIDNILIFSDDNRWCKQKYKEDIYTFIEGGKSYEDMYLMSLCDHNIVSNSSFSWWGSYLNKNKNKIVCAPSWWSPLHSEDIYFEGMTKIKI